MNAYELQMIRSVVSMGQFSLDEVKTRDPFWQGKACRLAEMQREKEFQKAAVR